MTLHAIMLLDNQWFAFWIAGCDVVVEKISLADAFWLEMLL